MVAPGKYLDFHESKYYAAKISPAPELANEITEYIKT
jgi:hypothetical protein